MFDFLGELVAAFAGGALFIVGPIMGFLMFPIGLVLNLFGLIDWW